MREPLRLHEVRTVRYGEWVSEAVSHPSRRVMISASGYEKRARFWASRVAEDLGDLAGVLVAVGFKDFQDALSRKENDGFYARLGIKLRYASSRSSKEFTRVVRELVRRGIDGSKNDGIEIHVDYSCMPRAWYCQLPQTLERLMRPTDKVFFWYTRGVYPDTEYPSAGVQDFLGFAGRASTRPKTRTHFIGLGFDRIRSSAIWSVTDPRNLVCFYAEKGAEDRYVRRVLKDNRDVLKNAKSSFSLPLDDFAFAHSALVDLVRQFNYFGDVIIVPDGPKPLILAASLVPLRLASSGIVCCHFTHRKADDFEPVEVEPSGVDPFGFTFCGRPS